MKIKFIAKGNNGCDWHRLWIPLDNTNFKDTDEVLMGLYGESEDPEDCDIYMFNRDVRMSPSELVALRKERGFKIVVDVDDYWVLPPSHYLWPIWDINGEDRKMIEFMKIADLVTTTSDRLKGKIRFYNQNVKVYPNALPFPELGARVPSEKMRFLYAGGITHEKDLDLLSPTFNRIEPFIRDKSEFILCGYSEGPTWQKMAKIFERTRSFRIYGALPVTEYMEHFEHADVVLVPLTKNDFNSHKSTLKIVEAATKGVPCIVSDVMPYADLHNTPGILWARNSADWLKHIRFCVKNPDWVREAGLALRQHMSERYNIKDWAAKRYSDLDEILHMHLHEQS